MKNEINLGEGRRFHSPSTTAGKATLDNPRAGHKLDIEHAAQLRMLISIGKQVHKEGGDLL